MAIPTLTKQGQVSGSGFTHDTWDALVYSSVVLLDPDGVTYRMYYTGYQSDGLAWGPCQATSTDLVTWTKPNLGQISFGGNTDNNIFILYDRVDMCDVIYAEGQFVGLFNNNDTSSSLIYTSSDGVTFSFAKTAFNQATHGEYVETKCIIFDGTTYRIYYAENHGAERRSLGYYESTTLTGTWTDQGLISTFTSTDQDVQYYDIHIWPYAGGWYACVPHFNKTTEILGPLEQYVSTDNGVTWTYVDTLLEMGAGGEFDDELIAAAKPILVNHHWNMMYVGSSENHAVWPRPMVFAWATGRENTSMSLTYHAPYYQTKSLTPVIGPTPTCTRALGSATYFDSSGVMQTAAANIARFDHNPVTGESLGLLIEEARTNLCLQSEELNTGWTHTLCARVAAAGVAPDGNTTMVRMDVSASDGLHRWFRGVTSTGSSNYVLSAFFKDDGARYVGLSWLGGANDWCTTVYDLTLGTVTQESEGATSGTIADSGVEDIGGGIYRCWMSCAVNDTDSFVIPQLHSSATPSLDTSGSETFVATEGNDALIWGVSVELGAFLTSYIKTTTGTQLRNADAISTTDVSWHNDSAATWYIKSSSKNLAADRKLLAVGVGTNVNDALTLWYDTPAGNFGIFRGTTTGDDGYIAFTSVATADVTMKVATAYANNDMVAYVDGVAGTPDTTVTVPPTNVADRMRLGSTQDAVERLNGHIQEIRYDNTRLDNAVVAQWSQGVFSDFISRPVSMDVARSVTKNLGDY